MSGLRIPFLVLAMALVRPAAAAAVEAVVPPFEPETYAISRYEPVWKRSPFIVETVAVQVSQGLAQRFALAGAATINGSPVAFLIDRQPPSPSRSRFMLAKGKPSDDGVELVSLSLSPDPRQTSIVIRQAGQQATLNFDPQMLAQVGNPGSGADSSPAPVTPQVPPPAAIPGAGFVPPNSSAPSNPGAVPPAPPPRRIIRPAPINVN